jgi:TP901 family phage tail tape measure protein
MPKNINELKRELEQLILALNKTTQGATAAQNIFDILSTAFDETGFSSNFAERQLNNLRTTIELNTLAAQGFNREIATVKAGLRDLTGAFPQLQPGTSGLMLPMGERTGIGTGPTIRAGPGTTTMGTGAAIRVSDPILAFEDRYRKMVEDANRVLRGAIPQQTQAGRSVAEMMDSSYRIDNIPYGAPPVARMEDTQAFRQNIQYQGLQGTQETLGSERWNYREVQLLNKEFGDGIKHAEKYGYRLDDLKRASRESSTGISTLRFQMEKVPGVFETLSVTTDRFGNVLQDQQKRFRGFFSTIGRNIQEAIKWSIAIKLVWGPLNKLGELIEIMIANEAKLADVTISLGEAQSEVNNIFKAASDVAAETGESIHGVLQGYELAVRATGGIKDETQRLEAAQILLKDSMVLSKLSSLEQAQAMDTLAGAQRQLQLGFDKGITLIDKWVAVSKNANVSVETLAESFAITAASASNAGLDLDELNGVITVVAENTTLSATEAGNAVRAFISGFQTDKAQKELTDFGIAVKTSTGEALGFYDVMQEISRLYQADIISDAQLNRIAEAIGGGARRGAQVVATIKDLNRVQEVATVSAAAHGDAEEALGIKLDTVQTKLTEVANAFQKLGQSLGTDGGVLDILKSLLDVSEGLIDTFTLLSKLLGSALPVILATTVGLGQIGKRGGFGGVANTVLASSLATGGTRGAVGVGASRLLRSTGLAVPAIAAGAGSNLLQGEYGQAGASTVGGIIGAAIGVSLGGPVGATIGASLGMGIGEAFVKNVLERKVEFSDFFRDTRSQAERDRDLPPTEDAIKTQQQIIADEINALTEAIAGAPWSVRTLEGFSVQFAENVTRAFQNIFRPEEEDVGYISAGQGALAWATPEQQARLETLRGLSGQREEPSPIENTQIQLARTYADELKVIREELNDQINTQRVLGQISDKQFKDSKNSLDGMVTSVTKLYASIGDLNAPSEAIVESFREMAEILIYASVEERGIINQLFGDLGNLSDRLETVKEAGGEIKIGDEIITTANVLQDIDDVTDKIETYKNTLYELQNIKELPGIPSVVDFAGGTSAQLQEALGRARGIFSGEFAAGVREGLYEGFEQSDFESQFESFFVNMGPGIGYVFVEGVRQSDLAEVIQEMVKEGAIAGMSNIGLRDFTDITESQLLGYAAQANQMQQALEGEFGIDLDEQTFIAWTSNAITGPITANQFILNMLMRDLIDVNEKQLEGVYNLPTDASFYVPFTGYALGQGGGGGLGSMEQLINAMNNLTGAVQENTVVTSTRPQGLDRPGFARHNIERPSAGVTPPTSQQAQQWWENISQYFGRPEFFNEQQGQPHQITEMVEPKSGLEKLIEADGQRQLEIFEANQVVNAEMLSLLKGIFMGDEEGGKSGIKTFMDTLWESLMNFIGGGGTGAGFGLGIGPKPDQSSELKTLEKTLDALNKAKVETSLSLDINSSTVLQLDGQVVAEVVKNYLYEDLIRQEDTSTSVSRSVVI